MKDDRLDLAPSLEALDRRALLRCLATGSCVLASGALSAQDVAGSRSLIDLEDSDLPLKPARWWKEIGEGRIECALCPKKCRVADLERGACGVRENRKGSYYTLVHSRPCSINLDPI